jgi:hypothetical protein
MLEFLNTKTGTLATFLGTFCGAYWASTAIVYPAKNTHSTKVDVREISKTPPPLSNTGAAALCQYMRERLGLSASADTAVTLKALLDKLPSMDNTERRGMATLVSEELAAWDITALRVAIGRRNDYYTDRLIFDIAHAWAINNTDAGVAQWSALPAQFKSPVAEALGQVVGSARTTEEVTRYANTLPVEDRGPFLSGAYYGMLAAHPLQAMSQMADIRNAATNCDPTDIVGHWAKTEPLALRQLMDAISTTDDAHLRANFAASLNSIERELASDCTMLYRVIGAGSNAKAFASQLLRYAEDDIGGPGALRLLAGGAILTNTLSLQDLTQALSASNIRPETRDGFAANAAAIANDAISITEFADLWKNVPRDFAAASPVTTVAKEALHNGGFEEFVQALPVVREAVSTDDYAMLLQELARVLDTHDNRKILQRAVEDGAIDQSDIAIVMETHARK